MRKIKCVSILIAIHSISSFGAKDVMVSDSWCRELCDGILHELFHSDLHVYIQSLDIRCVGHVNILKILAWNFLGNMLACHIQSFEDFFALFPGPWLFCWWANFATGCCACACVSPLGCVTFALMMRWSWLNELVFAKCLPKYASSYYRKVLDIYLHVRRKVLLCLDCIKNDVNETSLYSPS